MQYKNLLENCKIVLEGEYENEVKEFSQEILLPYIKDETSKEISLSEILKDMKIKDKEDKKMIVDGLDYLVKIGKIKWMDSKKETFMKK